MFPFYSVRSALSQAIIIVSIRVWRSRPRRNPNNDTVRRLSTRWPRQISGSFVHPTSSSLPLLPFAVASLVLWHSSRNSALDHSWNYFSRVAVKIWPPEKVSIIAIPPYIEHGTSLLGEPQTGLPPPWDSSQRSKRPQQNESRAILDDLANCENICCLYLQLDVIS